MGRTSIEWTDATWSPIAAFRRDNGKRGWHCEKVSAGCKGCYAERLNGRKLQSGTGLPYTRASRELVEIRAMNLDVPLRWRAPRRIFVESMSDVFAEFVPDELIDRVFAVMAVGTANVWRCRRRDCSHDPCDGDGSGRFARHTYQVLTKRPELMCAYVSHPERAERIARALGEIPGFTFSDTVFDRLCDVWPLPNVHLGVSVEDQATADERIPLLLRTPAAVRFVSYEPALGPVDFTRWMPPGPVSGACACGTLATGALGCYGYCQDPSGRSCDAVRCRGCGKLHSWSGSHTGNGRQNGQPIGQIIVGGESGPGARPCYVAWVRSTIEQCRAAGVAVFVKQLGAEPRLVNDSEQLDWPRLPGDENEPQRCGLAAGGGVLYSIPSVLDRKGGDMSEWPEDLRVREFPAPKASA